MNNMQLWLESPTGSINLNDNGNGYFLQPDLEGLTGLPEIRTTSGVNAGYDGGWTSAQFYDARLITINGLIVDQNVSQLEAKRRDLVSLVAQGRSTPLTLRFVTEGGNAYSLSVRTIAATMALKQILPTQEYLIQLRADDPLIYDDGASGGSEAILRVQQALGGFEIDFNLPLAIGGGDDATTVENSQEMAYPIIDLYGPLHSPTVINTTTNQQMQILADLGYTITWSGYQNETGTRIMVDSAIDGAPMALDTIKGDTEQASYSGKNLAPYIAGTTTNSVNLSVDSRGVYKLGGTASADTTFSVALPSTLASGTYRTMSINIIDGSITGTSTLRYRIRDTNGSYAGGPDIAEITVSSNSTGRLTKTIRNELKTLNIWVASGCACTNFRFTIQLENGQTATDFEPYVGGQPAPSPSYPQNISTVTGRQTVTVTGKNIWDSDFAISGIGSDGTKLNRADRFNSVSFIEVEPNTQYTFSATPKTAGKTAQVFFLAYDSQQSYIKQLPSNAWYGLPLTITTDQDTHYLKISGRYSDNTTFGTVGDATDAIQNVQLEKGNQATTFESYHGQSQEINLGKNLFDKAHANILQAGITATKIESATANRTLWIPCEPNTTYTVQKRNDGDTNRFSVATTVLEPAINVAITNRSEQPNAKSITYTTSATAKYLCVQYFRTAETVLTEQQVLDSIQIEKGYDATTYASYFTPIELCKIGTYQDKIYKSGDKWYLHKEVGKVVLDGSDGEGWTAQTSNNGYMYRATVSGVASNPADETSNLLSDFFTATSGQAIYSVTSGGFMAQLTVAGYIRFNIGDTTNKLADFKTWLGSNNTTVYYVLATATDTEITDATLLAQLNHAYSLYIGENNILSVTPNLMPEIKIAYATEKTEHRDLVSIDSQARTITFNGADAYHLMAEGSEFITIAPGDNNMYLTSAQTSDEGYAIVKFKQGYLSI